MTTSSLARAKLAWLDERNYANPFVDELIHEGVVHSLFAAQQALIEAHAVLHRTAHRAMLANRPLLAKRLAAYEEALNARNVAWDFFVISPRVNEAIRFYESQGVASDEATRRVHEAFRNVY